VARYDAKDVMESYRDLFRAREKIRKCVANSELNRLRKRLVVLGVAHVKSCGSKDPDLVGDEC
jgi:hypothetical protein